MIERSFTFKREGKYFVLLEAKITFICEQCGRKIYRVVKTKKKFPTQEEAERWAIQKLPATLPEGWGYKDTMLLCDACLKNF